MIFDGMIKQINDCKIYDEMDNFRTKATLVINSQQKLSVLLTFFLPLLSKFSIYDIIK